MSGGVAYVLDEDGGFRARCNTEMVGFEPVEDGAELRSLVEEHLARTGSAVAERLLSRWDESLSRFIKVMPHDFKRALTDNPTSTGSGFLTTESEEAA
jgi:glutamate synthase domain-containing protein 3